MKSGWALRNRNSRIESCEPVPNLELRVLKVVINRQKRVVVSLPCVRGFVRRLQSALQLGRQYFNVCFVSDGEMKRMNAEYRGKPQPTDILSFPWAGDGLVLPQRRAAPHRPRAAGHAQREFTGFLGDLVISLEAAQRNARAEGHSTENEVRWLILHGLLHLLGFDHETDGGQMTAVELFLRTRLGVDGARFWGQVKGQRARGNRKAGAGVRRAV